MTISADFRVAIILDVDDHGHKVNYFYTASKFLASIKSSRTVSRGVIDSCGGANLI
jgi:hypothetical protein